MSRFGSHRAMFQGRVSGRALECCGGCAAREATLQFGGSTLLADAPGMDDTGAHLLLPPLANAHDHARGVKPSSLGSFDLPLELWLLSMTGLPAVDPYLVAAAALGRQARGGVGSIMIHYTRPQDASRLVDELEIVARAAEDIGVRVAIAVALRDQNPLGYAPNAALLSGLSSADRDFVDARMLKAQPSAAEQVAWVDALAQRIESDLVTVQYGPYGLEWCSDELLRLVAERSAQDGRRVHMHLLESPTQREYLDFAHPQGPVQYLADIGMLSPRLSVAHATQMRPDEMDILAAHGVIVSINSSSNLLLRNGIAPAGEMQRRGVRLATGLDGFSMDDDDDALREFRLAYMLQRGRGLSKGWELGDVLTAAFQTGREAVTTIPASALVAGGPADVLVLDRHAITSGVVVPPDDAAMFALRAKAAHIQQMIVNGRSVFEAGALVGIDLPGIEAELDAQVRAGAADYLSWQQASARLMNRLAQFYGAGLHRRG